MNSAICNKKLNGEAKKEEENEAKEVAAKR